MATPKTFTTRIDLAPETRAQMIALLNQQLADTFDLFSQTKQAHWNVKGAQFYQLHELFDKLAEEVEGFVDLIAERATALGGTAMGTVRMAAGASRLPEYPVDTVDSRRTGTWHIGAAPDCRARAHALQRRRRRLSRSA